MPIPDSGCRSGGKLARKDARMRDLTWPICKQAFAIRAPAGRATKPVSCISRWRGLAKTFAEPISLERRTRFAGDVNLDFPPPAKT